MNATCAVFGFAALALLPPVALARSASDPYRNIPSAERARDFDSYPLDRVSRDVDARGKESRFKKGERGKFLANA